MPYSRGECGDFASVQLRVDWELAIDCSLDRWQDGGGLRTAKQIVKDRKSLFFLNIHKNVNF